MARIKLKNSQVKDKAPQPADLDVGGELGVNHHADNPGLFLKDTTGNIRKIAGPNSISSWWDRTGTVVSPANAGDVVSVAAGTDAAPSIQVGTGTTSKPGIYSPGADQLAISTGGSGRLFVAANGRVGVGASTPGGQLEVSRTSLTEPSLRLRYDAATYYADHLMDGGGHYVIYSPVTGASAGAIAIRTAGAFSVSTNNNAVGTQALRVDTAGRVLVNPDGPGTGFAVSLDPGATSSPLVRDSTGRVGVGIANPTALVDVARANYSGGPLIGARYNAANLRMGIGVANTNGVPFLGVNVNNSASSDSGTFDINGWANRLRMDNGNVVHERSTASGTAGNAITWTESLRIDSSGVITVGNGTTNAVSLDPGTTTAPLVRDSTGNVGVGTATPDVFSRGHGRILGLSGSASNSMFQANAAVGFAAGIELGAGGTRYGSVQADTSGLYLGTATTKPLSFVINNANAAQLDATGRLIVGTFAAQSGAKLQVDGAMRLFNFAGKTALDAAMPSPVTGCLASVADKLYFYDGTTWKEVTLGAALT